MAESIYEGIKQVKKVSSNGPELCAVCNAQLNRIDFAINHYISEHGYRLLYIGTEANFDDGQYQYTVAMLGHTDAK